MANELIQWGIIIILCFFVGTGEVHLRDLQWRMSNLFKTWDDLTQGDITEDMEIDDDIIEKFGDEK